MVGSRLLMPQVRAAFSRYRPRVLTVVVLLVVAAPLVLANLTHAFRDAGAETQSPGVYTFSGGWPLSWHRQVVRLTPTLVGNVVLAQQGNASRLAANLAIWLIILAMPAVACEFWLRRYRPRLRWSLRTMLVAVAIIAATSAWYAAARNRANLQDELIAALNARGGNVSVERVGPKWLDLIGADRYRRWIVAVNLPMRWDVGEEGDAEASQLLAQLRRLHHLRYLNLEVERLDAKTVEMLSRLKQVRTLCVSVLDMFGETPEGLAALAKMRHLQAFGFNGTVDPDTETAHACLAPIGNMTQLEHLKLGSMRIASESLQCLGELKNLKSLSLDDCYTSFSDELALLGNLPLLPRLEALDLTQSIIGDADLRCLAKTPNLKTLGLLYTDVTCTGLAELRSLKSLEELQIADELACKETLDSLLAIKHLNALHLDGTRLYWAKMYWNDESHAPSSEVGDLFLVCDALRDSNPGIMIDGGSLGRGWPETEIASEQDAAVVREVIWLQCQLMPWLPPNWAAKANLDRLEW